MEWVSSSLHTTSEHVLSSITTADAHTSAASSRLNWRPRRFKWTRPFRRKKKSGFCACAITFQTQSTLTLYTHFTAFRSETHSALLYLLCVLERRKQCCLFRISCLSVTKYVFGMRLHNSGIPEAKFVVAGQSNQVRFPCHLSGISSYARR
jgi:hypothetical protein